MSRYRSIDDLLNHDELGSTGWHLIDQARVAAFADVSGDHQWIHVVNVGFDRVRFRAPVLVGSRLRGTAKLLSSRRVGTGARVVVQVTAEIEGGGQPACVADQVLAFYA
jgi:acyl dehydratase